MQIATPKRRVILDAAIDDSVIRGTLIAPSGDRRDFHGWLELNTALEAMLDTGADHAPKHPAANAAVPAKARATRAAPPTTSSINPPAGGSVPRPTPSAHSHQWQARQMITPSHAITPAAPTCCDRPRQDCWLGSRWPARTADGAPLLTAAKVGLIVVPAAGGVAGGDPGDDDRGRLAGGGDVDPAVPVRQRADRVHRAGSSWVLSDRASALANGCAAGWAVRVAIEPTGGGSRARF
jgi:hypothetical protein